MKSIRIVSWENHPALARLLLVCGTLLLSMPLHSQTPLSLTEQEQLQYLREEEKLARDVYIALYSSSGLSIFANIAQSEQRHMDAVLSLLENYGLADPAAGNAEGVFTNAELQSLYDQSLAQGTVSATAALEVGVLIEETDIADLEEAIAATDNSAIIRVYSNLLKGSRNHLSAFSNNLAALVGDGSGGQGNSPLDPGTAVYEPISQSLYIPAMNIPNDEGAVIVYDVMFRLIETLPQTFELIAINETTKLASDLHAVYDLNSNTFVVPRLVVGALAVDSVAETEYTALFKLIQNTPEQVLFTLTEITEL
ncbi:MAG: DUF2202 domain-containing protein [Pseudohongiellaceae bacterium]